MFSQPARSIAKRIFRLCLVGMILAVVGVNLWAWYEYAEAGRLVERCHFSQAYADYTQALRIWRWSAVLHFQAARTARRAELYPEAEHHLAEFERRKGDNADEKLSLALERSLIQAQVGDLGAVEELLWQSIDRNVPETTLILEALARGYLRVFRLSIALTCLKKILEREPHNVEALVLTGKTIQKGGSDLEDGSKYYRLALELEPERDDARLRLAQILLRDRPEDARSNFQYVLARQPDNLEALLGLAQAERMLSETEKARTHLEAVLAREPENSKALMELGYMAFLSSQSAEAETLLRKAIAADPANRDAHYRLYQCLAQDPRREKEAAEEIAIKERLEADMARFGTIVSKEMSQHPHDPQLYYEIGSFYLRYGKPEIGIRWLQRSLRLKPDHEPSRRALYEYYRRTGDLQKAEEHRSQLP